MRKCIRLKHYANPKVEREFLERLGEVIPSGSRAIIITDAGFRGPWFRSVEEMGWDWIGRVRNMVKCQAVGGGKWKDVREWYKRATGKPKYLGRYRLSKQNPYECWLHLYKGKAKRAKAKRRTKQAHETRKQRLGRDPWLLATSLSPREWSARRMVKGYEKRMHIEETFRDLKSHRWGYGLQYARSYSSKRYENMLMFTTLAVLATWLVGMATKMQHLGKRFQANTETSRNVLSVFFLGRRMLKSHRLSVSTGDIKDAVRTLPDLINACAQHA